MSTDKDSNHTLRGPTCPSANGVSCDGPAHKDADGLPHTGASIPHDSEGEGSLLQSERAGTVIDGYKLLKPIGEGGFGVVWMAEQSEPVRRQVALKIIKLGMDTKQVVARFEQERQALAMMDHPNIAKVFDGGATPEGRPYFVMEWVRGIKITEYCDTANLSMNARLELFIAVCHAVQHAHQKGIIHRDLKPSNILVTLHDGVPVPKVIDFGVAKATQQERLSELTLFTQLEQLVGTPLYMAPEQAELSGLDVDTRSDIYSLGILLYELLTGRTPFDPERLRHASLDEMCRVIREEEPQKPSTRLTAMTVGARAEIAKSRQNDSGRLVRFLRGDLDWIIMKALEKDRNRRYETATAMANDIRNHLTDVPVLARPPSSGYRLKKLVRRNKLIFTTGTAVLLSLVLGLGLATWMFFQERRARDRSVVAEQRALTEDARSKEVARFLKDMIEGSGPSIALGRDTTLLKEILDGTDARLARLGNQPEVEADLRSVLGDVYRELSEYAKAEEMAVQVVDLRKKLWGEKHPDVAMALNDVALALEHQGKIEEAVTWQRESNIIYEAMNEEESPNSPEGVKVLTPVERKLNRAIGLMNLGNLIWQQGKLDEAENAIREGLEIGKEIGAEHAASTGVIANAFNTLAMVLTAKEEFAEAEEALNEALRFYKQIFDDEHPRILMVLSNLAHVFGQQGKHAEAEDAYAYILPLERKVYGDEHESVAISLNNLAEILFMQGKATEAERLYRESLDIRRKVLGEEHPGIARTLNNMGQLLMSQGRGQAAEDTYREALGIMRKVFKKPHPNLATCLANLAALLQRKGSLDEAEVLQRESLAVCRAVYGNRHLQVADACRTLASILVDLGRDDEAMEFAREAEQIRR